MGAERLTTAAGLGTVGLLSQGRADGGELLPDAPPLASEQAARQTARALDPVALGEKLLCSPEETAGLTAGLRAVDAIGRGRVDLDPDKIERGLAQLVLTVIELLRQLMERQALRRVEHGSLDDDAIERLGLAFMRLDERMEELKAIFELTDEDLNLDLGPLGKLM